MSEYDELIAYMVKNKVATPEQLKEVQISVQKKRGNFLQQLLSDGLLDASKLSKINREVYNLPIVALRELNIRRELTAQFKEAVVRKHTAMPVYANGGRLFIATIDPNNRSMLEEFKYQGKFTSVEPIIANLDAIEALIEEHYAGLGGMDDLFDDETEEKDLDAISNALGGLDANEEEAPVVRFVTGMLLDAIRTGASDLHFEPYETTYRVRFRRDGVLQEVAAPPPSIATRITARLKVMADLDIAEKRVPQDGRIKLYVSDTKAIDFRVNSLPTLWGEKIVLRILDSSAAKLNIEILGFEPDQKQQYLDAISKPQGLVLVTGPTGSGKTVSLYTGLNILNKPTVNISTAEDPVEINLPGINQVNVNPKTGLDFSAALKAFLRQDPDIIMVGEIRDITTAEIAVKAAQTGHLVLSTLHTNDVPQTIARLVNIGIEPYNIAASVNLIMAQRLARRLCNNCKIRDRKHHTEELLALGFHEEDLDDLKIYAPKGCERCSYQGYRGRAGIYQVVPISEAIAELILKNASAAEIAEQCLKEGYLDLRQAALNKVKQGLTSIEEVLRVTSE
ncbi:type IV-A pilus assembly ATPase PilB [Dichelobacter nodosus]|uniref:Type IV fimbrial biogenesis nucleotide binding protein FimN n=2 Tax=Dichelobacter nodosus TaxID=870 RepID=A5EXL7_DICNV|nr:type IV-A pilus assembly ATPase PilB [Dichelobacter nodosus]AAB65805.1 FimN [Dichelobacter nodosus]ABQ13569.1 type IV fimbrial biogenesis nucleotide binding protein FimN [Dichelobacter nodosus VCS1703A]AXM45902.1 type IV-A pilus assembly ATPase PilB [Dichelobacter nodosus]KNZ39069.1 general secretion pathway protein GspE [Dichelobacter nodosus]TGA64645.1 type IV-A pilus assembly ATPase PilB [Dichelobacter nodosus]